METGQIFLYKKPPVRFIKKSKTAATTVGTIHCYQAYNEHYLSNSQQKGPAFGQNGTPQQIGWILHQRRISTSNNWRICTTRSRTRWFLECMLEQRIGKMDNYAEQTNETSNPFPIEPLSTNLLDTLQKPVIDNNTGSPQIFSPALCLTPEHLSK